MVVPEQDPAHFIITILNESFAIHATKHMPLQIKVPWNLMVGIHTHQLKGEEQG